MGESYIITTYFADGRATGSVHFTEGEVIDWEGDYTVAGDMIQRTIEGRTEPIRFRVESDTMFHEIGKEDYTFKRLAADAGVQGDAEAPASEGGR